RPPRAPPRTPSPPPPPDPAARTRRARHYPARRTHRVDRLLKRTPGRHDVVDHEHALAGGEREPAPKLTTRCPFGPLGIDRARAELSGDLVRKDDPAGRGPGDGLHPECSSPHRNRRAEPLRLGRLLEDLELLQIERGVAPRGEDEVSLAKCP